MTSKSDQAMRRVVAATLDSLTALIGSTDDLDRAPDPQVRHRCGQAMVLITDALQTLTRATPVRPELLSTHLRHRGEATAVLAELREVATGEDDAASLLDQDRRLLADLSLALTDRIPSALDTLFGGARTIDYLRGIVVEATSLALRYGLTVPRTALIEASRALTTALGEQFGGSVIEVRVPPAAAVQLGALGQGPTHTRGTPPNVAELDPAVFIALGTGLLSWHEARAAHKVDASGAQVDLLEHMLPVVDLSGR